MSPGTSPLGVLLHFPDRSSGGTAGMAQWARSDGILYGLRPALATNRCPAAIVEGSFLTVDDAYRAYGTEIRVVITTDDALERMRTIVGGRHCVFRFAHGVGLVVAGTSRGRPDSQDRSAPTHTTPAGTTHRRMGSIREAKTHAEAMPLTLGCRQIWQSNSKKGQRHNLYTELYVRKP